MEKPGQLPSGKILMDSLPCLYELDILHALEEIKGSVLSTKAFIVKSSFVSEYTSVLNYETENHSVRAIALRTPWVPLEFDLSLFQSRWKKVRTPSPIFFYCFTELLRPIDELNQ